MLPEISHLTGSESRGCPYQCRDRPLPRTVLEQRDIRTLLVRVQQRVGVLFPRELALALGFPRRVVWGEMEPRLGLALLGDATSPLQAAVLLGKIAMLFAAIAGCPAPVNLVVSAAVERVTARSHEDGRASTAPHVPSPITPSPRSRSPRRGRGKTSPPKSLPPTLAIPSFTKARERIWSPFPFSCPVATVPTWTYALLSLSATSSARYLPWDTWRT
jgi:hypothetical protein